MWPPCCVCVYVREHVCECASVHVRACVHVRVFVSMLVCECVCADVAALVLAMLRLLSDWPHPTAPLHSLRGVCVPVRPTQSAALTPTPRMWIWHPALSLMRVSSSLSTACPSSEIEIGRPVGKVVHAGDDASSL